MKKKSKFKSKIDNVLAWSAIVAVCLLLVITAFFPLILSIITGNWWFTLLFLVSWIPVLFEVILIGIIVQFKSL